jgi:ComF family protein
VELILQTFKSTINLFLEVLFPSKCLGCQIKGEILCSKCLSKIPPAEREIDSQIFAIFDYRDPLIKKVIWSLKYYHYQQLGFKLGKVLYENLLEDVSDIREFSKGQKIIVIPVPVSRKKFRIRGYNQALAIASGFCQSGGKEIFDLKKNIIIKKIETLPQARIKNRNERLKNIRGVFCLKNENKIKNRIIFIIDDVTTTGGTINEIIRIVKKAEAKKVIGLAVAH